MVFNWSMAAPLFGRDSSVCMNNQLSKFDSVSRLRVWEWQLQWHLQCQHSLFWVRWLWSPVLTLRPVRSFNLTTVLHLGSFKFSVSSHDHLHLHSFSQSLRSNPSCVTNCSPSEYVCFVPKYDNKTSYPNLIGASWSEPHVYEKIAVPMYVSLRRGPCSTWTACKR